MVSPRPPFVEPKPSQTEDEEPSSLADAVMRELSEQIPDPRPSQPRRSIVEPSELRPRTPQPAASHLAGLTPIPPDAVVPAFEGDLTEIDAPIGPSANARLAADEQSIPIEIGSVVSAPVAPIEPPVHTPMTSVAARDGAPAAATKKSRWGWLAGITLVGVVGFAGLTATNAQDSAPAAPLPAAAARPAPQDVAALAPVPVSELTPAPQPAASRDGGTGERGTATVP
jgi:hypothetical protein